MKFVTFIVGLAFFTAVRTEYNESKYEQEIVNFREILKNGTYIDKSLLVKTFHEDNDTAVIVGAPPGFGKTVNILTLKHYYEIEVDANASEIIDKTKTKNYRLFEKLKISENRTFFNATFGKYPVVYVNYGYLDKIESYQTALEGTRQVLLDSFSRHKYLIGVENLWDDKLNVNYFKKFVDPISNKKLDEFDLMGALCFLSRLLNRHFGRRAIVLFDQYDAFSNSIISRNISNIDTRDFLDFFYVIVRSILEYSSPFVDKVFATATLPVIDHEVNPADERFKKYLFSRSPHRYSDYYGINEPELAELLKASSSSDAKKTGKLKNRIAEFCGGYIVPDGKGTPVYKTSSVVEYLRTKKLVSDPRPSLRSSTFSNFFQDKRVRQLLSELLEKNASIPSPAEEFFTRNNVTSLKQIMYHESEFQSNQTDLIVHFLQQFGYLSFKTDATTSDKDHLHLRLPNSEIKTEIEHILHSRMSHDESEPQSDRKRGARSSGKK